MAIRKTQRLRLDNWSQLRQRGDMYFLMGRFVDNGEPFIVSIHDTHSEALLFSIAYMGARQRERGFDYEVAKAS